MGVIQLKYGSGSAAPTSLKNGEFAINIDTNQLWYGSGSTNTPVSDIRLNSITAEKYIISSSVTHMTTSFSSGSTEFGDTADDTHTFTGNVTASGTLKVGTLTYPTSDGTDGQVLITDGAGVLTFDDNVTYVTVKNVETGQLSKGTPIHVTGTSGNTPEIVAASASLATHMPANFVLAENLAAEAEGRAILSGRLSGIDTSNGFTEGDNIYISAAGGYTATKPVGDNLIQNIGIVVKTDATNGSIFVTGAGRTNDVPNLADGKIFIGDSNNKAVTQSLSDAIGEAGNLTIDGTLTIGANQAGHDLTLHGASTNFSEMKWHAVYDHLKFSDSAKIVFGTGAQTPDFDSSIQANGSNLVIYNDTGNVQIGDTVEITGDLDITGDFKVSGNDIKNSNDSTCITFGTTTDNIVNINNQLRVGAPGADGGVDASFYSDDASKYMWWNHSGAQLHLEDNTKIVFGSGAISYSSDSQIYADGSDLKIENSEGNIKIGDTVEITGDLDVDGTITATKIEAATHVGHEGDANTGLQFASDSVTIEANNQNVAVFTSNAITFGKALSMGSDGDGESLSLYGSTSGVKIAWSAYGNGLLINDNTRVNFGTPSSGPSGDVYFNFDGTKLQLAPAATNGDNIFEITKPGTGTTSLNLQGDLTVDGDIAIGDDAEITSVGSMVFRIDSDANESSQNFYWRDNASDTIASLNESGLFSIFGTDLIHPKILLSQGSPTSTYGPPEIEFLRNSVTSDNADIGLLDFKARDSSGGEHTYAQIVGMTEETGAGTEGGKIKFKIASHDGDIVDGLVVEDGDANDEVDVTIANGADSLTTVSGNLTVNGSIIGKQRQVYFQNFIDDLVTTKHYLPFMNTSEQTTIYQEEAAVIMPCRGKVVSVSIRMSSVANTGDLTIGVHTVRPGISHFTTTNWVDEETETLAVESTDDYHSWNFVFSNAQHFEAGDLLSISILPSADYTSNTFWYAHTVIEYDWNNDLGSTSTEYDDNP